MESSSIELQAPMSEWLNAWAEARGMTLEQLVAHILMSYWEEWEDWDEFEEDSDSEEEGP